MPDDDGASRRAMAQVLRSWRQSGVDFLPRPLGARLDIHPFAAADSTTVAAVEPVNLPPSPISESDRDMARAAPLKLTGDAGVATELIWPDPKPKSLAARQKLLEPIRLEVAGCTRCKELSACRTQTVFGVGNVEPRLCFFGEAPGADEDKQGEPFVGRAGQLLDKIIEAMTLKREDVYILNTLKCRPPSNRTPLPDEVENCRGYFTRQLEILRPEFLVCLGACAAQALLQTKESIGKLRGRAHDYRGIKVFATYHPAYLLRNPPAKRDVWDDMKIVMKEMGLKVPKN